MLFHTMPAYDFMAFPITAITAVREPYVIIIIIVAVVIVVVVVVVVVVIISSIIFR